MEFALLTLTNVSPPMYSFQGNEWQARLAEIACSASLCAGAGFAVQAGVTGQGALGSLAKFSSSFAPELIEDVEKALGQVPGQ